MIDIPVEQMADMDNAAHVGVSASAITYLNLLSLHRSPVDLGFTTFWRRA